jgi:hypothetical protein
MSIPTRANFGCGGSDHAWSARSAAGSGPMSGRTGRIGRADVEETLTMAKLSDVEEANPPNRWRLVVRDCYCAGHVLLLRGDQASF